MTNQTAQEVPEAVEQLNAAFYLGEVGAVLDWAVKRRGEASNRRSTAAPLDRPSCTSLRQGLNPRSSLPLTHLLQTGKLQDLWNTLFWVSLVLACCLALHATVR